MARLANRLRALRFHRMPLSPGRQLSSNLIITGIPRSGTSLLCQLVSQAPNAHCVNEVFYSLDNLTDNLERTRRALARGKPVPATVAPDGQITTNTIRDNATVRYRSFDGDYDNDVIVASKVNIPYLSRLPDLVALGMGIVAVVRDPLWTIASWNTEAAQRIPEYWVTQEHLHTRWADWQFESTDRIGRQSEVWARYATLILDEASAGAIHVLTYERMTQGDPILLDSVLPGRGLALDATSLVSMNHRGRYPGVQIEHIAETVSANRLHDIYSALAGFSI